MISNFQIVRPDPRLGKYIERIFIIESTGPFPSEDLKLIVPNACPKLVIPFRNGLIGTSAQWEHVTKEFKTTFIGISDIPAKVDYLHNGPAGNITVEFSPLGAYRFFDLNWGDVKNSIYNYSDIHQKIAEELEDRLMHEPDLKQKVNIVQRFLLSWVGSRSEDPVFEYCIREISRSKGRINMKILEDDTGYSARWLNMKFHERLGISPKNLASIVRFQQYYRSLITQAEAFFLEKEFYHYFYDQSHFIKDFKRFTGHSPVLFSKANNDYDHFFYKE